MWSFGRIGSKVYYVIDSHDHAAHWRWAVSAHKRKIRRTNGKCESTNGPGGDHTEAVRTGFSPRKLFWEMPHGSGVRGILLRAAHNVQSRWRELVARHSPVGFLHPIEGLMLSVLHLDLVLRPSCLIGAVAMLRDKALEAELASLAKQVRPDLSLLKGVLENPLRSASEQPSNKAEVGADHRRP
jgi:hypothetical protein